MDRRSGWINVGDLNGAVHFKIVKYERIKFLVIALRDSIEIYAWAPKPYHKFMAFKVGSLKGFGFILCSLFPAHINRATLIFFSLSMVIPLGTL